VHIHAHLIPGYLNTIFFFYLANYISRDTATIMTQHQASGVVCCRRKIRELRGRQAAARRGQAFLRNIDQYRIGAPRRTQNRSRDRGTSLEAILDGIRNLSVESASENQPERDCAAKEAQEPAELGPGAEDLDWSFLDRKYREFADKDRALSNEIAALQAAKQEYEYDAMELCEPETSTA
jgi:hypothetical protein